MGEQDHEEKSMFVFLHIGKTAGLSIRRVISEAFGEEALSDPTKVYDLNDEKAAALRRHKFIHGHINWATANRFFPERQVFTFLRRPIDRCVSWYYFCRTSEPQRIIPLEEIARDGTGNWRQAGLQVQSLAHHLDLEAFLKFRHYHAVRNLENTMTKMLGFRDGAGEKNDDKQFLLEQAKQALNEMGFVGFLETINSDIIRLIEWLDGHMINPLGRENVTPKRPKVDEISDEARTLLEEMNDLDHQLYDYAWKRLGNP